VILEGNGDCVGGFVVVFGYDEVGFVCVWGFFFVGVFVV